MNCNDVRDLLSSLADGSASEIIREAEDHVLTCTRCAAEVEQARRFRAFLRNRMRLAPTPPDVQLRLAAALEAEDSAPSPHAGLRGWLASVRALRPYRWAVGAAVVALLLVAFLPLRSGERAIPLDAVVAHYAKVASGEVRFDLSTADVGALRAFYQQTGLFPFDDTVEDFSRFGFHLTGGTTSHLNGHDVTFSVYEGPGGYLLCHRFLARGFRNPPGGEPLGPHRIYSVQGITIVVLRLGNVICVLATDLPKDEFARLLASHPEA